MCEQIECVDCKFDAGNCWSNTMRWLISEYKEPILTDEEKEYLSVVVKPFKDKELMIVKKEEDDDYHDKVYEYISIYYIDNTNRIIDVLTFPKFEEGAMYKNMEDDKSYTLEQLGL